MQHTKAMPVRNRSKVNVLTSQRQRLIDHLKAGHSIHFLQAMEMNVPFLNDRIRELQRRNMPIQAKPIRIGRISCTEYSLQPAIHLQVLLADGQSWARLLINGQWLIECIYTILGSTRVCLRRQGEITLQCNWCAGKRPKDIVYLINVVLGYLEAGDTDLMPLCSRVKPYYQDTAFLATIQPYYRPHITDISQLLLTPAIKQTTSSFTA